MSGKPARLRRWLTGTRAAALAAIVLVATVSSVWAVLSLGQSGANSHARRAAIVDQLSLTAPDAAFVASARKTLEESGYSVDYVPGEQVTVEFYRHLPEHHYALIILRAHSGLSTITNLDTDTVTHTNSVSLFTGETFDPSKYQAERDAGRLGRSRYVQDGTEVLGVFGIEPNFVRHSMLGHFDNTLVILMGCSGLDSPSMAQAFISRGAEAVVGYDDFVSAPFTDAVTSELLTTLADSGATLEDVVAETSKQFGPDPEYGGRLQLVKS